MFSFVDGWSFSEEPSSALQMEAADATEMLIPVHQTRCSYIPEDSNVSR
jgi:hypothetical protein